MSPEHGDLLPGGGIPQSKVDAHASNGIGAHRHCSAIRREGYGLGGLSRSGEGEEQTILPAETPQVTPLEAAQVLLTWFRKLSVEELLGHRDVAIFPGVGSEIHL